MESLNQETAIIGEEVIVIKKPSEVHDEIGEIVKVGKYPSGESKVSVSFQGHIYSFRLEDLVLA